jgi:hypothetical protein
MTNDEAQAWADRNEAKWDAATFKLRLKDGRFVRANNFESAVEHAMKLPPPLPQP